MTAHRKSTSSSLFEFTLRLLHGPLPFFRPPFDVALDHHQIMTLLQIDSSPNCRPTALQALNALMSSVRLSATLGQSVDKVSKNQLVRDPP
jgi:hypothetical protein